MNRVISLSLLFVLLLPLPSEAARSLVIEAGGKACAAKGAATEKTAQQALDAALGEAHALAARHVVRQGALEGKEGEREIAQLYRMAPVRGLQELRKEQYRDSSGRRCMRVLVRAEVVPNEKNEPVLEAVLGNGPQAPLKVQVWPEQQVYRQGEKITFFIKGNKPFFGSIVYTDAAENIVQILPNSIHPEATFEAEKVYQLPPEGEFTIRVSPPAFGTERITVYAATAPLAQLADIVPTGEVEAGAAKRSTPKKGNGDVVEYVEAVATLTTREK